MNGEAADRGGDCLGYAMDSSANVRNFVTSKIMRNATPLKPRTRAKRTAAEVARWEKRRGEWVGTLEATLLFHRFFDHIPRAHLFANSRDAHLIFASQGVL